MYTEKYIEKHIYIFAVVQDGNMTAMPTNCGWAP